MEFVGQIERHLFWALRLDVALVLATFDMGFFLFVMLWAVGIER